MRVSGWDKLLSVVVWTAIVAFPLLMFAMLIWHPR